MKPSIVLSMVSLGSSLGGCTLHVYDHHTATNGRLHAASYPPHYAPSPAPATSPEPTPPARAAHSAPSAPIPVPGRVGAEPQEPVPRTASPPRPTQSSPPRLSTASRRPSKPVAAGSPRSASPGTAVAAPPGADAPPPKTGRPMVVAAPVLPAAKSDERPRDPLMPILTPTADTRLPEGEKKPHRGKVAHRK